VDGDDDAEDFRDPTVALLEMLTRAFGIRLTEDEAAGPLLTIQPPLSRPGMQARPPDEASFVEVPDDLG
jgi:hypothetical protein